MQSHNPGPQDQARGNWLWLSARSEAETRDPAPPLAGGAASLIKGETSQTVIPAAVCPGLGPGRE
jgi:hypothetical protein